MKTKVIYIARTFRKLANGRKGKVFIETKFTTIEDATQRLQDYVYEFGRNLYYTIDVVFEETNE